MKKKILIISRFFYPDNNPRSFRATELAKELALQGHRVTILTPKRPDFHFDFEANHGIEIKDLGHLRFKRPDFGKSKIGSIFTRAINRILQLAFDYPDIELFFKVRKLLKSESGYDFMISIAVPHTIHWGVASARSENHLIAKTWIADCGDPYMGEKTDTFRRWFYFKYIEKWFMRKVDFVTIPTENSRIAYYEEFHSKIYIIPQGFKIEPLPNKEKYIPHLVPNFAFAGSFNLGNRDPRPFLKYLATLETDFIFSIYTKKREIVEPFLVQLKDKVIISDTIPRNELLPKLSSMDFLINFDNNSNIQVPSKLIDYNICNRPVLNITKDLNPSAIQEFLAGNYSQSMHLGNIDLYRIENVCEQFLNLTNEPGY